MVKSVEVFRHGASSLRTGRANPALVERLSVELYGTTMVLNQVATISAPDPRLLVVQPFDRGTIGALQKEIQRADIGSRPATTAS